MKPINVKKILSYLPEVSILAIALGWFIENILATPSYFNYLMLAIIVLISALIIWRIKAFAITLSVLIGLGSFYMLLAVLSEYSEFPKGDPDGHKLLFTGLLIIASLITMSIIMPIKYLSKSKHPKT